MSTVPILDDNRARSAYLKMALTRHGFKVARHETCRDVVAWGYTDPPDLILVNHAFKKGRE